MSTNRERGQSGSAETPDHTPYTPCPSPLAQGGLLASVTRLKREGLRGRDLRKQQEWRLRAEAKGGRLPLLPPSRLAFDAGGAETSPLPETRGQTDKHRWRERLRCFIYGPGDRPSPVSESLIYQAEETSHPLATGFPPSETGAQPGSEPPRISQGYACDASACGLGQSVQGLQRHTLGSSHSTKWGPTPGPPPHVPPGLA